MNDAYLDELLSRLTAGQDPWQAQRSMVASDRQEILRRCAVPRSFDRTIFDEVLNRPAKAPLDELVHDGYAESVPGPESLFRLRSEIRDDWLAEWPAGPEDRVPPGVVELCGRLADAHAAHRDRLEELYYLAVADGRRAVTLATELFDEADRRFDLAGCQDVLDTLSEPGRLQWLGPELAAIRADRHAYLRARSYWSTEFLQSARYLNRPALDAPLERLITGDGPRVLQIHAPGGSGKTMQLRWFIARWCVPEPRRIPCARIDFDQASPTAAGQRPWLLLLELADQLNRQLPGAPFQELLNDRGVLRSLLDIVPSRTLATAHATGQLSADHQVSKEVTDRFIRTLAETAGDRPVVLVFDTFEQVLLHPEGRPGAILEQLAEVVRRCPAVRLLVAGRYDLRDPDRVPDLDEILPGLTTVAIGPFTEDEGHAYLTKRGVTDAGLAGAMILKSAGDPFKLALFADLARDQDGLTIEEVLDYDDPETIKLVERIISRVDDGPIRWLLRYGVVPRRLSRSFVTQVMPPYLRAAMSGNSQLDEPRDDALPGAEEGRLFRTDLLASRDEPLDLNPVWQRLTQYASASSWVSLQVEHPDSVLFHPDLLTPMRRVLRKQGVFLDLHAAAATYCDLRAEQEPDSWVAWTLDAVFHRFQAGAADAADRWLDALGRAENRGGPEDRSRVAAELLRPDYVDDEGTPLPFVDDSDRLLVPWTLLARAHFERARATVLRAEQAGAGAAIRIDDALAELRLAERLWSDHGPADAPTGEITLVHAVASRLTGNVGEAGRIAERALPDAHGADQVALRELVADGLVEREPERAIALYYEILDDADLLARRGVGQKLARVLAGLDQTQQALAVLGGLGHEPAPTDADAPALIEEGRIWLRAGDPAGLLDRLRNTPPSPARAWCVAAAYLAQGRPFRALAQLNQAMGQQTTPPSGVHVRLNLEMAELHAVINATLLNLDAAYAELEYVTSGWRELGDVERSWSAAGEPADFDLRGVATLGRHAEYLVFGSGDAEEHRGGEGWFRRRLSELRTAVETGRPDRDELFQQTVRVMGPGIAPHCTVRLGLVILPVDSEIGVRMLLEGLRRMDTPRARLSLLAPLRRSERIDITPWERDELDQLLGLPEELRDSGILQLIRADVQRVFGDRRQALDAIEDLARRWPSEEELQDSNYRTWLLRDAAERLEPGSRAVAHLGYPIWEEEYAPVLSGSGGVLWSLSNPGHRDVNSVLDQAETLLARGGAAGSPWEAYLHIGRALHGLAVGDAGRCRQFWQRAELVWTRIRPLLPVPYAERFGGIVAPELPDEAPPADLDPTIAAWARRQAVVALTRRRDDLTVTLRRPPGPDRKYPRELARFAGDVLSAQLDAVVDDLLGSRTTLRPLVETIALLEEGAWTDAIALQTDSTLVGAIPWELIPGSFCRVLRDSLTVTHTVAALQRGLRAALDVTIAVDGLNGPETGNTTRSFLARSGRSGRFDEADWEALHRAGRKPDRRPEVLVVRPSTSRELSHGRGGLSEGVDIALLYERHGFEVTTTVNTDPKALADRIRKTTLRGRFAVLHVAGGFGASSNEVYVEFASAQEVSDLGKRFGMSSSSALFGTTFDRAFAALPPEYPRPLVILDPGRPKGDSEAMRQLVLRNAFTHLLLELGNIPVVLAMGLDSTSQYERRNDLVRLLADGGTAAAFMRFEDDRFPAVLSTHVPPYVMQRWWTT